SLRARHSCQSSINRLFTSTVLDATDDLLLALRAFGPIARAESCRSAKGPASGFACASLRFSGVNARTGGDCTGSVCEEGISCRGVSVNASSKRLLCPRVILPLELERFAT